MLKRHKIFIDLTIVYLIIRIFAIHPLDLFSISNDLVHVTNVEGNSTTLDGDYYIYTDKGAFINRDSILVGKFNSHDVQTYLFNMHDKEHELNCNIISSGLRIYGPGKLSSVPNILKIDCTPKKFSSASSAQPFPQKI
jgi:hypothetical protein